MQAKAFLRVLVTIFIKIQDNCCTAKVYYYQYISNTKQVIVCKLQLKIV